MTKSYEVSVDCPNCANKMEQAAAQTAGVAAARLDFMAQKLTISFVGGADEAAVMAAVIERCRQVESDAEIFFEKQERTSRKETMFVLWRIVAAVLVLLLTPLLPLGGAGRFALYLASYLVVGWDVLFRAAKGLWRRQLLDESFLMAVASLGAMLLGLFRTGDYTEAVLVMLLYQLGEFFQDYAVGRSRKSVAALMDIRPDYANWEKVGCVERTPPQLVPCGSVIVVATGERIPIDGIVTEGSASLDTAALTGESLPREVGEGDAVVSGSVNLSGLLKIRTTKEFGESTVSKILELVENAGSRKARSEDFIARFARIYTPAVCLAALALALLPPLAMLTTGRAALWSEWLYRALSFLVISCPCALVISVPLSFFGGIGGASRAGILIKGANFLESLSKLGGIAFDKTGTLTKGEFTVSEIVSPKGCEEELLELAALAESASPHPLARAIRAAWGGALPSARVSGISECGGLGVLALVDGRRVLVGRALWLERQGISVPAVARVSEVQVAVDGEYAGFLRLEDRLKPTAAEAMAALRRAGVEKTVMLTGDSRTNAARTAAALGMTEYRAELLPADKVSELERLLEEKAPNTTLAYVGDGINDAPVLARADIGIAMGALGSDAAIEAADVVIMDDDPRKLATAVHAARKCMRIVRQNIVFSIGVKLVCLLLAALGLAGMGVAVFADVGVMVLAVLNAMRALLVKKI